MEIKSIQEIEDEIVGEFNLFDNWDDKYEYIIELGKNLPLIDSKYKDDRHKVSGCQSQVWLNAELKDGRLIFSADSDAIITKGLISLLIRVLSNQKPSEVSEAKLDFLDRIGMKEHLSQTRANGLMSMVNHMKKYAKEKQADI